MPVKADQTILGEIEVPNTGLTIRATKGEWIPPGKKTEPVPMFYLTLVYPSGYEGKLGAFGTNKVSALKAVADEGLFDDFLAMCESETDDEDS